MVEVEWGDHPQFPALYESFLDAAYGGRRGRARLAAAVADQLNRVQARTVLDCAAGTGFPSLELAERRIGDQMIHSCDGDEAMVAHLAMRAGALGIDVGDLVPRHRTGPSTSVTEGMLVRWADLGLLADQYDYVLCRGNALAYADTWAGGTAVASEKRLLGYLANMRDRIAPGGHLHVDAPIKLELDTVSHRVSDDHALTIDERVRADDGRREWRVEFKAHEGESVIAFRRYSSELTIDKVKDLLDKLGFAETNRVRLDGERSNFGVIIARKPH